MKVADSHRSRLAIVVSHPTQYYSPWFRWLSQNTELQVKVFYLWNFGVAQTRDPQFETTFEWDVDLLSGYDYVFVPNVSRNPGAESFWGFNNPTLTKQLSEWKPSAILLFGYNWASHLRVVFWAGWRGIPLIFRGDSHLLGRPKPPLFTRLALRILYSRFAAFLCVGSANRDYFRTFGVPAPKLFFAPHSVNAELFDKGHPEQRKLADKLRSGLGLKDGMRVVLFAGKMIPAKQPLELLEAFARLDLPMTAAIFVGEGPEREALRSRALAINAESSVPRVILLPFSNQTEMPSRYLASDIFALPSRGVYETWGLAVNEAMLMGVPCLVSERVGCQDDLVTDRVTGWVFDSEDRQALYTSLKTAFEDIGNPSKRKEMQTAVEQRITGYTYAHTTAGLIAALASLAP